MWLASMTILGPIGDDPLDFVTRSSCWGGKVIPVASACKGSASYLAPADGIRLPVFEAEISERRRFFGSTQSRQSA